ncbi:hypothetical protein [Pseudoalteromonas sp. SG45-2]|nr:hypothetical protein [Pseudoalteromonas sp. SG45-2]
MLTQFDKYVKAALLVRQQARRLHGHHTPRIKIHVGVKLAHAI